MIPSNEYKCRFNNANGLRESNVVNYSNLQWRYAIHNILSLFPVFKYPVYYRNGIRLTYLLWCFFALRLSFNEIHLWRLMPITSASKRKQFHSYNFAEHITKFDKWFCVYHMNSILLSWTNNYLFEGFVACTWVYICLPNIISSFKLLGDKKK